jgi:hypothetical protein
MLDKNPKLKSQQNLMQITQPRFSIAPTLTLNNFFGFQNSTHLQKKPATQQKHARIQAHTKELQTNNKT